jgi:hypothetical protein
MSGAMELTEREFKQIGSYVREHLGSWIREIAPPVTTVQLDPVYLERMVRVEEELRSQRDLMKQGFEHLDRRLDEARHHTNVWLTVLSIFLGLMTVAVTVTNLM